VYNDIEVKFGIDAYASSHDGFAAVLKARFSDFCVHEVDMDGNLAELLSVSGSTEDNDAHDKSNVSTPSCGDNNKKICPEVSVSGTDPLLPKLAPHDLSTLDNDQSDDMIRKRLQKAQVQLATIVGEVEASRAVQMLLYWSLQIKPSSAEMEPSKYHAFPILEDKEQRKKLHLTLKGPSISPYAVADTLDSQVRLWHRRFETEMPNFGKFGNDSCNRAAHNKRKHPSARKNSAPNTDWPSDRPNYLKFVLYKENMDTTTACKELGRKLRLPFNNRQENTIGYAGMKDKRGVTSQFCTIHRKTPADLAIVNQTTSGSGGGNTISGSVNVLRVGNFSYTDKCISLGSLSGNRFHVVLRNVNVTNPDNTAGEDNVTGKIKRAEIVLEKAATSLKNVGFINYFGMQRFGKYLDNHEVGLELLRGNFEQAVHIIMREKKTEQQQERVIEARRQWCNRFNQNTIAGSAAVMKEQVERKVANSIQKAFGRFMICENKLMEHLSKRPLDYKGAMIRALPRNMTLMFLHALQSYIWNKSASFRIMHGGCTDVTVGDLVLVDDNSLADGGSGTSGLLGKRVHVTTEQDVLAKKFSIVDVVLPLVGSKVMYPTNKVGSFIDDLLCKECLLSKKDLIQKDKELTLGGDYRKLICKPHDVQWEILRYEDPLQPLIQTDLMKVTGEDLKPFPNADGSSACDKNLLGMVVGFTLPPSSYATIALRELMRRPTVSEYQKQLSLEGHCEVGLLPVATIT
jgi:tRNA pseudouridine13 synthase